MICLCPKAHFLIISNNSQFAQPINGRFFLMSKTSCLWKTRILSPKAFVCIVWDIIYLPVMVSSSDFFKVSFVFITLRNKHFKKKSLSSFSLFEITFFLNLVHVYIPAHMIINLRDFGYSIISVYFWNCESFHTSLHIAFEMTYIIDSKP